MSRFFLITVILINSIWQEMQICEIYQLGNLTYLKVKVRIFSTFLKLRISLKKKTSLEVAKLCFCMIIVHIYIGAKITLF